MRLKAIIESLGNRPCKTNGIRIDACSAELTSTARTSGTFSNRYQFLGVLAGASDGHRRLFPRPTGRDDRHAAARHGRHDRGALHRRALDAAAGPARGGTRQGGARHDYLHQGAVPIEPREPGVQGAAVQPVVDVGVHQCLGLAGLAVSGFRHRRASPPHRGPAGEQFHAHGLCARRIGRRAVSPPARARRRVDPSQRSAASGTTQSATANAWPRPAYSLQRAAEEIAMTTPWPRQSAGCTKPN